FRGGRHLQFVRAAPPHPTHLGYRTRCLSSANAFRLSHQNCFGKRIYLLTICCDQRRQLPSARSKHFESARSEKCIAFGYAHDSDLVAKPPGQTRSTFPHFLSSF